MRHHTAAPSVVVLLIASISLAASGENVPPANTNPSGTQTPDRSDEFGTLDMTVTSVFAGALTAEDSSLLVKTNPNGYRYIASAGGGQMLASVSIPSGVVIDYIVLNNCDVAGGNFTLTLRDSTFSDNFTPVGSVTTTSNLCAFNRNVSDINYPFPQNLGHNLELWVSEGPLTPTDGTAGVQSMEVWWHRRVSPAPASATFNDVPTSDPAFQFIEAFNAAGITAGCSAAPPLFCPDKTVTRRQMAVFFAKALGLHWSQ